MPLRIADTILIVSFALRCFYCCHRRLGTTPLNRQTLQPFTQQNLNRSIIPVDEQAEHAFF